MVHDNRVHPDEDAEKYGSLLASKRPAPVDVNSRSEEATDTHKLFCPICMYYFVEMQKTTCCSHHLCDDCYFELVKHATTSTSDGDEVTQPSPSFPRIPCPHCASERLERVPIRAGEEGRHYDDSPAINRKNGPSASTPMRPQGGGVNPSPLKVGDTYESMMKKMLTYDQCGINIHGADSETPGREAGGVGGAGLHLSRGSDLEDARLLPGVPFPPLPEDERDRKSVV